jgi:PIN domain nuclease of toxin-antitoxin system
MRLLLDIHVFRWYITVDLRLPATVRLPLLHHEPFDWLLVVQGLQHGLAVVAVDPDVAAYGVPLLPAA